jgi:uncharacterized protein
VALTPEEARVLGCLLEKERSTPDAYPLSLNALVSACNQSTNRAPVVHYDEATVERGLDDLRQRGLVRRGVYPGSRVIKYRHVVGDALKLSPGESALLCVLLLRGPQTPGELKSRTERMHPFDDLAAVDGALDALAGRDEPLARRLTREPGQKEARVRELLTQSDGIVAEADVDLAPPGSGGGPEFGEPEPRAVEPAPPVRPTRPERTEPDAAGLESRVAALEQEIAVLRGELERLRDSLGG